MQRMTKTIQTMQTLIKLVKQWWNNVNNDKTTQTMIKKM